jgi:hypothetical protein
MPVSKYTVVSYDKTDVGPIYLEDVGPRPQLGRGVMGQIGQDIVINPGDIIPLVNTGAVMLSKEKGTLKAFEASLTLDEVDTIVGYTGIGTRAALVGRKTDPAETIGDF